MIPKNKLIAIYMLLTKIIYYFKKNISRIIEFAVSISTWPNKVSIVSPRSKSVIASTCLNKDEHAMW